MYLGTQPAGNQSAESKLGKMNKTKKTMTENGLVYAITMTENGLVYDMA